VSAQTVSRVINRRPDVSVDTRHRVQKVIEELGYEPNVLARSLIQQRSHALGVVTAGLRHIGPSRTLGGITAAAEEAGYALLLEELPSYDTNEIVPKLQALRSRQVDGVIWAVPEVGENRRWIYGLPTELDIPIVYLAMEPRQGVSQVSINNRLGATLAMQHLLRQGYRRVAHVAGPLDWWEARQRKAAWQSVLQAAGLQVVESQWAEGTWSSNSGAEAAERLFATYPDMDAVFVGNDQMALGVLHVAAQHGRQVPEDLGVASFDNIPEAAYFCPPLTTVQQDQFNVGKAAVEEIARIIEARWDGQEHVEPRSIMLAPSLVVRQSTRRSSGNAELSEPPHEGNSQADA
jgi:LacI family transcriptional regulator